MSTFELSPEPAHAVAPTILVVDGEVVIVGPGAIAYSMTLAAATEMLERLARALAEAGAGKETGEGRLPSSREPR